MTTPIAVPVPVPPGHIVDQVGALLYQLAQDHRHGTTITQGQLPFVDAIVAAIQQQTNLHPAQRVALWAAPVQRHLQNMEVEMRAAQHMPTSFTTSYALALHGTPLGQVVFAHTTYGVVTENISAHSRMALATRLNAWMDTHPERPWNQLFASLGQI